jgi:hypothetical protein
MGEFRTIGGVRMLTLSAPQAETLWDGLLPVSRTSCPA